MFPINNTLAKPVHFPLDAEGMRPHGPPAFLPSNIAGLELEFDSLDISTLWQDSGEATAVELDGDPVGSWNHNGSAAYSPIQTVSASKPTYKTNGINGTPAIYGDNDFLTDVSTSLEFLHDGSPHTVFIVMAASTGGFDVVMGNNRLTATDRGFAWSSHTSTGKFFQFIAGLGGTKISLTTVATVTGSAALITLQSEYNRAGNDSELRIDGAFDVGADFVAVPETGIATNDTRLFSGGTNLATDFYLGDILAYNSILSAGNVGFVETHLAGRRGITI